MTQSRMQMFSNMSTRQKMTAVIFVLVFLFLLYEIFSMLGGGTKAAPPRARPNTPMNAAGPGVPPPVPTPTPVAQLPKPPPVMSQREMELIKLQQDTEAKYIAALNELQMLKLEQQMAETTRAIFAAKLDTVTSQKNIIDLLKPPAPVTTAGYAQGLINPAPVVPVGARTPTPPPPVAPTGPTIIQAPSAPLPPPQQAEAAYTVISVSLLQNRWSAVVGYQGNLFNVNLGDFLPPDQSKVVTIDRSGVVLERNGLKRKVSLVPII